MSTTPATHAVVEVVVARAGAHADERKQRLTVHACPVVTLRKVEDQR